MLAAALCVVFLPAAQDPLPGSTEGHRPSVALGDLDGDGHADLVLGQNGPFAVRPGLPPGGAARFGDERRLGREVAVSCENCGQPGLADLDGDGDLDLVALDTPLGGAERAVWFANDGRGHFSAAAPIRSADGRPLRWLGQASGLAIADWDGDGRLDLLLATPEVVWHRGGERGFAATPQALGGRSSGAIAVATAPAGGAPLLLLVEGQQVQARPRTADGLGAPRPVAQLAGDPGQARLALGDWRGDGQPSLWLGETLAAPQPAAAPLRPQDQQRAAAAKRVLAAIDAARAELNATRPPRDDAAAMAARSEFRAELDRWAAAPKAVLEALRAPTAPAKTQATSRIVPLR